MPVQASRSISPRPACGERAISPSSSLILAPMGFQPALNSTGIQRRDPSERCGMKPANRDDGFPARWAVRPRSSIAPPRSGAAPRAAMAEAAWASKSAIVSAREASTPMPPASRTQSSSGLCRSSIDADGRAGAPRPPARAFQAADAVLVGVGEMTDLSVFRQTPAGLAGKGEERHRRLGATRIRTSRSLRTSTICSAK